MSQLAMSLLGSPDPWKSVMPANCPAKLFVRLVAVVLRSVSPPTEEMAPVVRADDVPKSISGPAGAWTCALSAAGCPLRAEAVPSETNPARSKVWMMYLFMVESVFK